VRRVVIGSANGAGSIAAARGGNGTVFEESVVCAE
jgi:hypothetical protein